MHPLGCSLKGLICKSALKHCCGVWVMSLKDKAWWRLTTQDYLVKNEPLLKNWLLTNKISILKLNRNYCTVHCLIKSTRYIIRSENQLCIGGFKNDFKNYIKYPSLCFLSKKITKKWKSSSVVRRDVWAREALQDQRVRVR